MKSSSIESRVVPPDLMCPITLGVLSHPMTSVYPDPCNCTYVRRPVAFERVAIERWRDECLARRRVFCDPTTNMPMSERLEPATMLVNVIRAYFECISSGIRATELMRHVAASNVDSDVHASRDAALACELIRIGCDKLGLMRMVETSRAHGGAVRALARAHGVRAAPHSLSRGLVVQYTRMRARLKARAVELASGRVLAEVRVVLSRPRGVMQYRSGVLIVQYFSGGDVGAAVLGFLMRRFDLAPRCLRVGGVSGVAYHDLRRLGIDGSSDMCIHRKMHEALRSLNVRYGIATSHAKWRASPLWHPIESPSR